MTETKPKDKTLLVHQGECPSCGEPLEHFSGIEHSPEYLYCRICLDYAYGLDGSVIARLE